jgi:hypothetical protein
VLSGFNFFPFISYLRFIIEIFCLRSTLYKSALVGEAGKPLSMEKCRFYLLLLFENKLPNSVWV